MAIAYEQPSVKEGKIRRLPPRIGSQRRGGPLADM
jgi:hypothetical protein